VKVLCLVTWTCFYR